MAVSKAVAILQENKTWMISWTIAVIMIIATIHFWPQGPSPVPENIRSEAGFSVIYPAGYTIETNSWKFLSSSGLVEFTATKDGYNVIFNEQETPLAYQNDTAAYERFIGSLQPSATFTVPLGSVSLTNFVTTGTYEVVGETGLLNADGTMLSAHPDTQITDDQWRALFTALKVD